MDRRHGCGARRSGPADAGSLNIAAKSAVMSSKEGSGGGRVAKNDGAACLILPFIAAFGAGNFSVDRTLLKCEF